MGDIVSDIFGGGGGGGGGSAAQSAQAASPVQDVTQTSELPGWARGYAKDVLARGAALTDINQNPYQRYGGQRIADFSGLQKQAFAQAGPQGFQSAIGSYMSPYMQNVVDIQKREAARQSGIAGAQQAGQATMAGAFGGGRDAILRAERERNLMTQLGDIQQQGSQAAFDRATQQYNTGIGQLSSLGALQQAQAQKGLDIPYQEFLNQQNYPYQQLSYMSNLVRGTPMGMTNTSQVYQAPGSALGQLAGLGMMGYGLSKMAEGGQVEGYDDGGSILDKFNDPGEMMAEMDKLTDVQLQAILKAPSTRAEALAAKEELAQRASDERGLSNAWEQVPYSNRENIVRAAGGGVLAFSGEDDSFVVDPMLGTMVDTSGSGDDRTIMERLGIFNPENRRALEAAERKAKTKEVTPYDRATATRREDFTPVGGNKGISAALGKSGPRASGITASPAGVSTTPTAGGSSSFLEDLKTAREALRDPESEAATKSLNALIAKQGERAGQLKEQGMNQFFVDYGAALAQGASQPGQARGRGLSGLLQSAAAAAPAGAQSMARTKAAVAQAEDNNLKMQLEMQKYNIALRKGDLQTATSLASNIRMMQQQQAQLAETIRHNKASEGLMGQRIAAGNAGLESTMLRSKAAIAQSSMKQATKDWNDPLNGPKLRKEYPSLKSYQQELFNQQWSQTMPQLSYLGTLGGDDTGG